LTISACNAGISSAIHDAAGRISSQLAVMSRR